MNCTDMKVEKQGAEAKIYRTEFLGKPTIIKERFLKKYRHPTLDMALCKERTRMEARSLIRCRAVGIHTPAVYFVDGAANRIYMEYIEGGVTVKEYITKAEAEEKCDEVLSSLAQKMGHTLAGLHNADIIHGDLTTSNMLLRPPYDTSEVVLIDFGLSYVEAGAEDKAVDVDVLERALLSTHPATHGGILERLLQEYFARINGAASVRKKLEEVRRRGRKRTMVG